MQTEFDTLLEEEVETLVDETKIQTLVLHNDDFNTFDWVITSLLEICKMTVEQAEQLTLMVHYKGKAKVKRGEFQTLKPLKDAFLDRGIGATID